MKAACVVAHPDDCIIFARPFIDQHTDLSWHIFYLTYEMYHSRVVEMKNYWYGKRHIPVTSLGYVDTHLDMENNKISFNELQAAQELKNMVQPFEIVLTHNPDGDYGHIHHKFVSSVIADSEKPTVHFANHLQANLELTAKDVLNLDEFPVHQSVLQDFKDINVGRYFITDQIRELINGKS